MYIDRSYLVFGNVERFVESDTERFSKTTQAGYHPCHGGVSVIDLQFKEFVIECKTCALFLFNDSIIRTESHGSQKILKLALRIWPNAISLLCP